MELKLFGDSVVFIEWEDASNPASIIAINTESQQFYCKTQKGGTLLAEHDFGGDAARFDYWVAPGSKSPKTYGDRARQVPLPDPEMIQRLFDSAFFVDDIQFCVVCQDSTFEARFNVSECGHLRYIEEISGWGGCGYGEEDRSATYQKAFQRLVQQVQEEPAMAWDTPENLCQWLRYREVETIWDFTDRYDHFEDLEPALKYLDSLTKEVPAEIFDAAINWVEGK